MARSMKFYKLGDKASLFSCPQTGLTISGNNVGCLPTKSAALSKKVKTATAGGHLVEISEAEFEKLGGKLPGPAENTNEVATSAPAAKAEETEDEESEDEDEESEDEDEEEKPKKSRRKK